MKHLAAAAFLPAVALAAVPAEAAVFAFAYNRDGVAASGTFTTADQPAGNGFFLVTAADGTRNGQAITLLPAGGLTADPTNDNLVNPLGPFLTEGGIAFTAGGVVYNIFFDGTAYGEFSVGPPALEIALSVVRQDLPAPAGVPEPGGWATMLAGFGLLGAGLRAAQRTRANRSNRRVAAPR